MTHKLDKSLLLILSDDYQKYIEGSSVTWYEHGGSLKEKSHFPVQAAKLTFEDDDVKLCVLKLPH